ncbi:MAG: long-chain fatty acid--CoA ligase [Rhodospirillaceae bacterium]|nr:long-chain fatty acid--CoA ligase [Rhodospirillaceae bacterium]
MSSALDRCRRYYADRPAVIDREGRWTWAGHLDRIARLAGGLQALGVKRGDAFATLSRNTFRNFELLHAGYWMGAVPAPVNIRLAAPEIAYILDNAGAEVVAVDAPFLGLFDHEALAPWRDRTIRIAGAQDDAADADADAAADPGAAWPEHDYETLIAGAEPAGLHEAQETDPAILLYTGGTTGRSKGVPLSHRNAVSNGMQVGHTVGIYSDDVYLHVAPMFHSADLLGTGFTLMGSGHAFLPAFTPADLLGAIQDRGVTWTMLAPTMIIMTLQLEDLSRYDLSSLRAFLYGSAPMAAEWVERTLKAFDGVELIQGYGLTETSPILTLMSHREHVEAIATGNRERLKAAGRPIIGVDMRILGPDGREVPNGESGEVVVRAPNVTAGYLNLPEENARAFRGGWFHTGDVGRMDDNGFMYLIDRKKDMIITGGENVYSLEVEAALYQHPAVGECAVIGIPDSKYGEALFAAVVPQPGQSVGAEELVAHCRERIGGYKIPRQYAFLPELPKSAMGKILKTALRETYSDPAAERETVAR